MSSLITYMFIFVYNSRNKSRKHSFLSVEELNSDLLLLVETVQMVCFSDEYDCLLENKDQPKKSFNR